MGVLLGVPKKVGWDLFVLYQCVVLFGFVPIIAPSFLIKSPGYRCIALLFLTRMCIFARCGCDKIEATDDQYICFNELNNATWEFCKTCNRRSSPFCERRF